MIANINTLYNILGRPLINKLSVVISPKYLLIKFKIEKGVTSVRGDQLEARKTV